MSRHAGSCLSSHVLATGELPTGAEDEMHASSILDRTQQDGGYIIYLKSRNARTHSLSAVHRTELLNSSKLFVVTQVSLSSQQSDDCINICEPADNYESD